MTFLKKISSLKNKISIFILLNFSSFQALANSSAGDETDIANDSVGFLVKTTVVLACTILPLEFILEIGKVKAGKQEPADAAKPLLLTTLIVAAPAICEGINALWSAYTS